jgi:single stranded DNA-binding protein
MEHLTISGRLGGDAEVKTTARGNKYVSFRIAVDSRGKGGETTTNWYNVSSFQENHTGKMVEFLKKGKGLIVSGTPSYSSWTDKSGTPRIDLNVKAFNIEFPTLGRKEDNNPSEDSQVTKPTDTSTSVKSYVPQATGEPEDDLPF